MERVPRDPPNPPRVSSPSSSKPRTNAPTPTRVISPRSFRLAQEAVKPARIIYPISPQPLSGQLAPQNDTEPIIHYFKYASREKDQLHVISKGGEMSRRQRDALSQVFAHIPEKKRPDEGISLVANDAKFATYVKANVDTGSYKVLSQRSPEGQAKKAHGSR